MATWSVPTIVVAQHAKAESTAAHGAAPSAAPAKETPKDANKGAAKPTSEHAAAKSDGKDKDTVAHEVEGAKGPAHASAEKASSAKEAEPAAGGKKVARPASARSKTAPKNELEAALKRIDEQIAVMRTSPSAAQSSKPRVESDARSVRAVPAPSTARVHLSWRTALVWAPELDGEADGAHEAPHVELVWPATEPLKSTPITLGSVR
ncbi:MAG: hypothetical protein ABMA15_00310 [Vicinamibacterales bacterium]